MSFGLRAASQSIHDRSTNLEDHLYPSVGTLQLQTARSSQLKASSLLETFNVFKKIIRVDFRWLGISPDA